MANQRDVSLIRIGTATNESALHKPIGFDLLFNGYHELVPILDFNPWTRVNGSWQGALGHLFNGTSKMDQKPRFTTNICFACPSFPFFIFVH